MAHAFIAQLILERPGAYDEATFDALRDLGIGEWNLRDVRGEVAAGRRNIAEMPLLAARVLRLFGQDEHSVKAPAALHAVPDLTAEGFEELVYPNGRNHE